MILTRDELIEITGYRRQSLIIQVLKANRIPVLLVGPDGWPRVLRTSLTGAPRTLTTSVPDTAALIDMQRGRNGTRKNKTKGFT